MSKTKLFSLDKWILFRQSDIINSFPEEYREGICYGLCLEYARYISKGGDRSPAEFIKKMNAKFGLGYIAPENLKARLEQYQDYQAFVDNISLRSSDAALNDEVLNNVVELVNKNLDVHNLSIGWVSRVGTRGHSIAVHKTQDGRYIIFDPNIGIRIAVDEKEFASELKDLVGWYTALPIISTENFSQLIQEARAKGDFVTLEETERVIEKQEDNKQSTQKTAKYLAKDRIEFLRLHKKFIQSKGVAGDFNDEDFQNIDQATLKQASELKDINGNSLLHLLTQKKKNDIIGFLLASGANPDIRNNNGEAPLHIATMINDLDLMTLISQNAPDVNAQDNFGATPLHIAVTEHNMDAVSFLLANGADANIRNNKGETPIDIAVSMNSIALARMLRRESDRPEAERPLTPLVRAIMKRDQDSVRLLLENSADINAQYKNGWTPLHMAIRCNTNAARLLLERGGANINAQDDFGKTPLHMAIMYNKLDVVKLLLENEADINLKNNNDKTPLHMASSRDADGKKITLLLERANTNIQNKEGESSKVDPPQTFVQKLNSKSQGQEIRLNGK